MRYLYFMKEVMGKLLSDADARSDEAVTKLVVSVNTAGSPWLGE